MHRSEKVSVMIRVHAGLTSHRWGWCEPKWVEGEKEALMDDVEAKVKEVLLEILDVKAEQIVPLARFVDDLNATSIDLVEIVAALQNTFDVDIDDAQVARLRTVQDAVDFFTAAIAAKRRAF
jgi:acyl carrier protein